MTVHQEHRLRRLSVWVLAFASVLALGTAIYATTTQARYSDCQARYSERQAAYLRAWQAAQDQRVDAAAQDRAAQDALFNGIAASPRDSIELVRRYNAARAQADAKRAANPIPSPPPLPSTVCH